MYLVSVYPTNRTLDKKKPHFNNPLCQGGVIYRLTQVSGCVFISDILGNGDSNSCDGMCDDKRGITSLG